MARKKTTVKVDTLDAVKIFNDDEEEATVNEKAPKPPKDEKLEATPKPPSEPPKEPVISKPKKDQPKPKQPDRYKVLEMRHVYIRGQKCTMKAGRIISEASHGPGIVDILQRAGVKLELVKD